MPLVDQTFLEVLILKSDKEVIRYFMTITEAAQLVIQASSLSKGGDVFLLDMGKPIKIIDLMNNDLKNTYNHKYHYNFY